MRIRDSLRLVFVLAACSSEIPVAGPKETGYGDMISADAGEVNEPDAGPTFEDADIAPIDEEEASVAPVDAQTGAPDVQLPPRDAGPSPPSYATAREAYAADLVNVTHPQELTQITGALPVIVWANDGCSRDDSGSYPLFDRWARAGFVVVSPFAAADRGLVGLLGTLTTTDTGSHVNMIDWVSEQDQRGPYAGKLDLARMILAGNGCGGVTALSAASSDARPKAVFVLSGSSSLGGVSTSALRAIKVPVGFLVGGSEDTASTNAKRDYDALPSNVPAILVRRSTGNHLALSSDASILAEAAEIALHWMNLTLAGDRAAYEALTSSSLCSNCMSGTWTLYSKHLETLPR